MINLTYIQTLPSSMRIFLYRQAMKHLKDYVIDTSTPIDDYALRVFGELLAEVLQIDAPDNLRLTEAEKQNPGQPQNPS